MNIFANAKVPWFSSGDGKASCRFFAPLFPHLEYHPGACLENINRRVAALIRGHQPLPRATESQLDSEGGCDKDVNFSAFNFLQVARRNFRPFRQFILRKILAHPLTAHVCTEDLDSLPFFLGYGHDILHRFLMPKMNDTYIVKKFQILLASNGREACNQHVSRPIQKQFQRN